MLLPPTPSYIYIKTCTQVYPSKIGSLPVHSQFLTWSLCNLTALKHVIRCRRYRAYRAAGAEELILRTMCPAIWRLCRLHQGEGVRDIGVITRLRVYEDALREFWVDPEELVRQEYANKVLASTAPLNPC
jgi:hypothetical protein